MLFWVPLLVDRFKMVQPWGLCFLARVAAVGIKSLLLFIVHLPLGECYCCCCLIVGSAIVSVRFNVSRVVSLELCCD